MEGMVHGWHGLMLAVHIHEPYTMKQRRSSGHVPTLSTHCREQDTVITQW
ncbi:hypothetical protein JOB18_032786 [Solea senegalensis]|uniref:Uncharacterized protein n=1 Tax=Solea senegalensis TaxID=28829 RepID=A0AAV6Q5T6_SOLSE|nr:hypothetical protein JOB18_032786 [Solea senegalensis]